MSEKSDPTFSILCYGDSNTWGYNPVTKKRYGRYERWTGVLQQELGNRFQVIEEGLNGRTTVHEDILEEGRNGKSFLLPCMRSHKPLDIVVLVLGTNDLKRRNGVSAKEIAESIKVLVTLIQQSDTGPEGSSPAVLLVAPPPLAELNEYRDAFEGGREKSRLLATLYQQVAEETNCLYINAGKIIDSSPVDGIHWNLPEHQKLGKSIADLILSILV